MTGFAPIVHGFVRFGWRAMVKQSGVPYYFGEGFLLFLGAVFYTVSWLAFISVPSIFKLYRLVWRLDFKSYVWYC
jgi:hypothetical protein